MRRFFPGMVIGLMLATVLASSAPAAANYANAFTGLNQLALNLRFAIDPSTGVSYDPILRPMLFNELKSKLPAAVKVIKNPVVSADGWTMGDGELAVQVNLQQDNTRVLSKLYFGTVNVSVVRLVLVPGSGPFRASVYEKEWLIRAAAPSQIGTELQRCLTEFTLSFSADFSAARPDL